MKPFHSKSILLTNILILFLLGFSTGCREVRLPDPVEGTRYPIPTIHLLFDGQDQTGLPTGVSEEPTKIAPTVADFFVRQSTPTPSPTTLPTQRATVQATPTPDLELVTVNIYDDELNSNWELLDREGMDFDLTGAPVSHTGQNAISITPAKEFGRLFFAVRKDAQTAYPRAKTVGISFWINGGDNYIGVGDLAVTAVGSNIYPYWVEEDRSVYQAGEFPFSETRLYYLGFNRSIPPRTWIKVEVWLNELIYDPYYEYVTGFYIKNDKDFLKTFYIDDVSLVMLEPVK